MRSRTALSGIAAVLAVVTATAWNGVGSVASRAPHPEAALSAPSFRSWAPTYMADDHSYTEAEAVALARRFDLVAALPKTFKQHVDEMRAANPRVVLLTYANGMLTPPVMAGRLPDEWFAKDSDGELIQSRQFGQYLMDAGQAGWRSFSVDLCRQKTELSGYDGCFVDMLTMGVFAPRYLTSPPAGAESDPNAVRTEYQENLIRLASEFSELQGIVVAANTVTSASTYFADQAGTKAVAGELPLNQSEDFLRSGTDPAGAFPGAAEWRADVAVLQDLARLGSGALVTTKLWVPADADRTRQWERFSLASFMLGAGDESYYAFTSSRTIEGATALGNRYEVPGGIGEPVTEMVVWRGLYARPFTGGLVLVNPTSSPVTLTLPGPMLSWDDEDQTEVTVPAHDGTVLFGTTPSLEGATSAVWLLGAATSPASMPLGAVQPKPAVPSTAAADGGVPSRGEFAQ